MPRTLMSLLLACVLSSCSASPKPEKLPDSKLNSNYLQTLALVPKPKSYTSKTGTFKADFPLAFNIPKGSNLSEKTIRIALSSVIELKNKPAKNPLQKGLRLIIQEPDIKNNSSQAYKLSVESERITIKGRTAAAVLMGLRTLAQLAIDGDIPQCDITDWPDIELRAAHLCYCHVRETMAYNVPNFDALIEHIDRLASLKYNAVLLELTAMFPYQKHPALPCKIAFTPQQIKAIRDRLRAHRMEVIPLIQSLGHVYYVLMHDEYASYRETPDKTQQYCPTNPKVVDLYMEFVDEYLKIFPDIRQIHIGGDESRQLGQCPRCRAKVDKLGKSRLYLDHMTKIVKRLKRLGLTPLIWDDMLTKHSKDLDMLPKYTKLVHWNYAKGHRRYVANMHMRKGFTVVGAPGVRFSAYGTELSVYYPAAMRGIELLIPRIYQDGCREIIVTNWMKGSPHENTDYGLAYAADLCWDTRIDRENFKKRYAKLTFGLDNAKICTVYDKLSLWLPYAEPVQSHMIDNLDRLNISGRRFPQKWQEYTNPEKEPRVIRDLTAARARGQEAQNILNEVKPLCTRGKRQIDLLRMSAECIKAKAQFALLLHQGRHLEQSKTDQIAKWLAQQPAAMKAWRAAKKKHHRLLSKTGFAPVIDLLNELMFEEAEYDFMAQMGRRMTQKVTTP